MSENDNYTIEDFEAMISDLATSQAVIQGALTEMNRRHKDLFLNVGFKMIKTINLSGWNDTDIENIFEMMVVIMYYRLRQPEVTINNFNISDLPTKVKNFIKKFFTKISKADDKYNKEVQKENWKRMKMNRKKHDKIDAKNKKDEKERHKAIFKEQEERKKNRKRNKFCKNETEFFTTEDIEDIPTEELTFIKYNESIYCLDSMSYVNMLKHSDSQKVRGDCKPPIRNKPLECKNFYPINIGFNFFINEKSYKKRLEAVNKKIQKRKFILKNKKRINFDTGLHIIGIKQGWDDVYDLEPANYAIPQSTQEISKKISKKKIEKLKNYTIKQLKAECKRKGIKGYSKLKKSELILHCSVSDARKKNITVKELRQQCKKLKIKGYSKWKKAELMKNCNK